MVKKCIVYSVPKSGTHFVSQILALLINPNCNIYDKDSLYKIVPHAMSTKLANLPFYNTHPMYIPYNIIKNAPHKVIYLIREPLDLTISCFYFHYYNRQNKSVRDNIDKNLNKNMYNWCLSKIQFYCNKIILHIQNQINHKNSFLINYNKLNSNIKLSIKFIANQLNIKCNDQLIEFISNKVNIKNCKEYERKKKLFKVGSVQNNYFFRDGTNNQYLKHFNQNQINNLISKIPIVLRKYFKL